ncbi:MAG: hypothetical protein IKG46_08425 [Solobacterium sp.]|nr:hypothetical protein [Solobacterium sp.]
MALPITEKNMGREYIVFPVCVPPVVTKTEILERLTSKAWFSLFFRILYQKQKTIEK